MSWFKRPGDRKSVSPGRCRSDTDPNTCLEVFQNHWKQACTVILLQDRKAITASGQATSDGVELVMHNLESMITLLVSEDDDGGMPGPILHYVMEAELLETFCNWCSVNCPLYDQLRIRQLRLFELVISQSHQMLLIHKPVIKPLLKLLMEVAESSEINNGELEFKLVLVLHQICICISQQGLILESFFSTDTDHGPARFLIFSLLIPFIHREGPVGQKARDALLLIMTLSSRHPHIGHYIANNSHFCPVLATGLSGLYSSLPRRIPQPSEDWHAITKEDCVKIPDLQMFINSLQFSNAVVQVAHPLVRDQLIHFIYTGFLLPVLAPALHQDIPGLPIPLLDKDLFRISREEVTTATAYLDLFIRQVTEPHLLKAVLQFILAEKFDDALILDTLISRLSSNSLLSTVTLSLFNTLVDLNCEDIMFQLVFRYLVPCTHVMVSQRRSVRDLDLYGKSAEKFLSLRPSCCTGHQSGNINPSTPTPSTPTLPPTVSMTSSTQAHRPPAKSFSVGSGSFPSPSSPDTHGPAQHKEASGESSYFEYLHEAKARLEQVGRACKQWKHLYNGENPPPDCLSASKEEDPNTKDVKDETRKDEDKKDMPGFLEVGSFSSMPPPVSTEKKNESKVHFKLPVDETEEDESRSADVVVPASKSNNVKTADPRLFGSLKDLDSFLQYLYDLDVSKEGVDLPEKGSISDSLASLDNLINSLLTAETAKSGSTSDMPGSSGDSSALDISMSSISPIAANTTQFSFISHSELPQGASVLESTAFTDISPGQLVHSEKTAFDEITMSEVPKDVPVKVEDCSSFVNISLVQASSKPVEDLPANDQLVDARTPKSERKVPRDFKKGFKFNTSLFQSPSSLLSPKCGPGTAGDGVPAYRLFMSPMTEDLPALTPTSPKRQLKYTTDPPNIGPFLTSLFSRMESMVTNKLSFNLLLTGLLARLACYPQPLLRSFLLNHNLVFQPSVKSMIQVLSLLKQKLESQSVGVKEFDAMVAKARDSLLQSEDSAATDSHESPDTSPNPLGTTGNVSQQQPVKQRSETISVMNTTKEKKKVTLTDLLFRRSGREKMGRGKNAGKGSQLQRVEVSGSAGYLYINKPQWGNNSSGEDGHSNHCAAGDGSSRGGGGGVGASGSSRNAVYCALVLDEFLKELAALSQEHSVLCLDEGYLSS